MSPVAAPTPARRRTPRLRVLVTVALAVVALGELGVRASGDRFPAAPEFHSPEADVKVDQMEAMADGADVVVLGSSLTAAGIDPEMVSERLGGVSVYNAGLTAGVPLLSAPWGLEVVLPRLEPRLVIVGVSSFDLADTAAATTFRDAFAESPAGLRALGEDGVLDRLDRWISDRSALWDRRRALRDPGAWPDALRGGRAEDPWVSGIGPHGGNRSLVGGRFEERPPHTGPPVGDWDLGVDNPAALAQLVDGIRAAGATPVLVNMPVTDAYVQRHPGGQDDQDRYRRALRELARDRGVLLLDYELRDTDSFADVVHLNGAGMRQLSDQLAADLDQRAWPPSPMMLRPDQAVGPPVAVPRAGS